MITAILGTYDIKYFSLEFFDTMFLFWTVCIKEYEIKLICFLLLDVLCILTNYVFLLS